MNLTIIFFVSSALLCFVLAIFADKIHHWSNRFTREMGLIRLADFREKLWPILGPIARVLLVLTGIGILVSVWELMNKP